MVLAPFFGNKTAAAPLIWQMLDTRSNSYVEPFCGLAGVLFHRPHKPGGASEVIGDKDGTICNTLRAIRTEPEALAAALDTPLHECDIQAQAIRLQEARRDETLLGLLRADPEYHDLRLAEYWLRVHCSTIAGSAVSGSWIAMYNPVTKRKEPAKTKDQTRGIGFSKPSISGLKGVLNLDTDRRVAYLQAHARRLDRVYITTGDWQRTLYQSAAENSGQAIFLDPPYSKTVQRDTTNCYVSHDSDISLEVEQWCLEHSNAQARIVLAGYKDEHDRLLDYGWRKYDSVASGTGYSRGEMRSTTGWEKLWVSPSCPAIHDNTLF